MPLQDLIEQWNQMFLKLTFMKI